ncbi:hypothetical protein ZIOFF_062220 [Zingiber officinale]|uniref:Uncharacterized protein n=1 Tax=Zingiber officinale TaxID=94328 RepID=A0A8J5F0S6_ZINOF|nr:hypothetical protein ZIOFF_062220 [Zingiber officinale]
MNVNRDETEHGKRVAERWTKITETKDQFNLGLSVTGAKDAGDGVYPKLPVLKLNLLGKLGAIKAKPRTHAESVRVQLLPEDVLQPSGSPWPSECSQARAKPGRHA